ncbi:hypothetical protein RD792_014291 [Penstemon davidsonii]|uniref:Uncharacterized protein n=1 Tax=Penstemon davidsonii TaxID=160366 RepID=A0ABR0CP46_9LAMI|nr:hypothetical protein RD792_014291 [Penstemon davidsonii]
MSQANFAWWEPGHGRFTFRHPWNQYLKIGILAKECTTQIDVLARFLNSKAQVASKFHRKIQKPCTTLSTESSKALRELSHSFKNMRFPSSAVQIYIRNSKATADYLKTTLENSSLPHKQNLQEIMQLIVISSSGGAKDIIKCVEEISVSVHELSQMARFRDQKSTSTLDKEQKSLLRRGFVNVVDDDIGDGDDHAVIDIHGAYSKDTSGRNILLPLEREQQLCAYIE